MTLLALRFRARARAAASALEYGVIAALILLVILGAVTHLGVNLKTLFGTESTSISSASAQIGGASSPYCSAQNLAAPSLYSAVGQPWVYPSAACGSNGITAPGGTLSCGFAYPGGCVFTQYKNSSGVEVSYSELVNFSNTVNSPSSETMFHDGYVMSVSYRAYIGLSYSQLAEQCSAGGYTVSNSYLGDTIVYNAGTPSVDSAGDFVCGGTSIRSGSLTNYW